jgi:hypothetical protein
MVSTTKANHQGSTADAAQPAANSPWPMAAHSAATSSRPVCTAGWRLTSSTFTATNTTADSTPRPAVATVRPASISTPAAAEASGAAKAKRRFSATARSMPITVPSSATTIRKAWCSAAGGSQGGVPSIGSATPARSRPPATPATKAAASAGTMPAINTERGSMPFSGRRAG